VHEAISAMKERRAADYPALGELRRFSELG
jgi:hypothetical protein